MTNQRNKADILNRVKCIEDDLIKAHEFLETGTHADWHGFRAIFKPKVVDGKTAPPHREWVKNVFIPRRELSLKDAEDLLDRFE